MPDITAAERRRMTEESRRRGAAAQHAQRVKGPKMDVYHRRRDIRAEIAAEDRERGRCTW